MTSGDAGPPREQIEIPPYLDKETVNWFLERMGHLALEMGLEEITAGRKGPFTAEEILEFNELSTQKPTTDEGKAGALYILSRVIDFASAAYDESY